jgi:cleavage and polyadenylation specificity factor subunit 1
MLFAILAANGLALNLEKCVFAVSELDFQGHCISAAGVAPLRDNVQVILDFPKPTDCKAMQRFLGMINFHCSFLLGVAGTLRPLTTALSGNPKALPWMPDMETAFVAAKAALVTAVPKAHPLPGAVLALATDASDTPVRAVLIRNDKLEARQFFLFHFKGTPSKDQQKTYRCRLTTFKVTLTSQSHFADFFDSARSLYAVTSTL